MILILLLIITFSGGILAWVSGRYNKNNPRWICLIALLADLILASFLSINNPQQIQFPWIPQFGITFYLAADGLSLLLILLTIFLGIIAVVSSWSEIQNNIGFFHFNLMLILTGVLGVFMAVDLFLFYFFWELMLVPMYFLISIWGHENRAYASFKFFLFTQASGLLMFLAILGLYFIHGRGTGNYTFDYTQLLDTPLSRGAAIWLLLGFFIAFAVKLPVVPFHTWLADAHTQAPTAGSVILAGLLLKTGAYGLIRFAVPLFPEVAFRFASVAMALAVIGILYGAALAFAQTDLKRLIAYTSISHLGFALLGIFSWNSLALQGAVMVLLAHGFTTAALFVLVGALSERLRTRDLNLMGGLWTIMPRMGGVGMFLALASLGLPGLANFVGEFLVLVGSFKVNPVLTIIAALGFIASVIYSLWLIYRTFHGPVSNTWNVPDLGLREMTVFAVMILMIIWLGFYPQPVLNTAQPALDSLQQLTSITNPAK